MGRLSGCLLVIIIFVIVPIVGLLVGSRRTGGGGSPVRETRIAAEDVEVTAKMVPLLNEARRALRAGSIDAAKDRITAAVNIGRKLKPSDRVVALAGARELDRLIQRGTDPIRIRETLAKIPDEAFRELRETGSLPAQLKSGYEGLDSRIAELAKAEVEAVVILRKERLLAQLEAEREREKEVQREAEAASARREEGQKLEKDRRDAYTTLLKTAGVKSIREVSVRRIGNSIWEATLTVENLWHIRHKQIRLQDAQTLWEAWARVASARNPDSARIKLVDLRGNEVGGSRNLAGSLIWVQED